MKSTNLMIQLDTHTKGLAKDLVSNLAEAFLPLLKNWDELQEEYDNILLTSCTEGISEGLSECARDVRLKLVRIRTATEKARKQQKEVYLKTGQAIQWLANTIRDELQPQEEKLKDIEDYEKIQAEKRIAESQISRLKKVYEIYNFYDIPVSEEAVNTKFGEMSEDMFSSFLTGLQVRLAETKKQREETNQQAMQLQEQVRKDNQAAQQKLEKDLQKERARIQDLELKLKKESLEKASADEENARQRRLSKQRLKEEEEERKEKDKLEFDQEPLFVVLIFLLF